MHNHSMVRANRKQPTENNTQKSPLPAVSLAGVWFCPAPLDEGPDDACLAFYCEAEKLFIQFSQELYNGNTRHAAALVSDLCRVLDAAIDARRERLP